MCTCGTSGLHITFYGYERRLSDQMQNNIVILNHGQGVGSGVIESHNLIAARGHVVFYAPTMLIFKSESESEMNLSESTCTQIHSEIMCQYRSYYIIIITVNGRLPF